MKFIENVEPKKFDAFVKSNKYKSHFLQSYVWGEFSKEAKKLTPYYVGLEDEEGNLQATALLLQKRLPLGYTYFYAPRGFVLDFSDFDLIKEFTTCLKQFAKSKKAIFIKIDPDIKLRDIDTDATPIDNGNNQYELVSYLKKIGYKHHGYNKNFEGEEPRYTFRLDLTPPIEEITNNFHATTKRVIKKGNPYGLKVVKNDDASMDDLYVTLMETAKRENIIYHDIDYYQKFYSILHKNNMSDIYIIKVNTDELKENYDQKIEEFKKNIKSEVKNPNIIKEYTNQLNKLEKERENLNQIKEKDVPLSTVITAKYGNKVWMVHGGNHSILRELNGCYFMYYEVIKEAKKEGYKYIDLFGTTGNPKPDNPIYGIHLFKQRLNGEYMEFIGEFDLVTNGFMYFVFTKLIPVYRKIQRKMRKS